MEAHGGTLELKSEKGVGTTATIRFPKERVVQ
jgi:signal transduction histidine kinase